MRFYKNLYVSESMAKKKEKVIAKLNKKKYPLKTYVIALIEEGENQLEFYSTLMFRQGSVIDDDIFAVGLASGYDDAHAKVAFSARKNIRRPTNIIYSGDSFHKDAYQVILDQNAFPFSGNKAPDQNRVATGLSFRHLLSVNILYVDSHITPRNYSYLNSTRNTYFTKND